MHRILRAILPLSLAAYALLVVTGALSLVGTPPPATTPAIAVPPADAPRPGNLASFRAGARVRASSAAWRNSHYPLYAIDEEAAPTLDEKWMTNTGDQERWIEVLLPRPATPGRIELDLASAREDSPHRPHHAVVSCARDERPIWEQRLAVTGSHLHAPLLCPEIDRVRVRFEGGDVRLYEMRLIEATAASPSSEPGS